MREISRRIVFARDGFTLFEVIFAGHLNICGGRHFIGLSGPGTAIFEQQVEYGESWQMIDYYEKFRQRKVS